MGSDDDPRDPVARPRGLLEGALEAINASPLSGAGRERTIPDRGERGPATPAPDEEAPALLPGDPSNLGARGRRRRTQDDPNASPVLRRGLLGV